MHRLLLLLLLLAHACSGVQARDAMQEYHKVIARYRECLAALTKQREDEASAAAAGDDDDDDAVDRRDDADKPKGLYGVPMLGNTPQRNRLGRSSTVGSVSSRPLTRHMPLSTRADALTRSRSATTASSVVSDTPKPAPVKKVSVNERNLLMALDRMADEAAKCMCGSVRRCV